MSIFTSLWFWILVLGILLTIAAVIAWAVTGNADILVGILLGLGVGWIIGGLLIWIFGRSKKPADIPPMPPTGLYGTAPTSMLGSTMPANTSLFSTTMPSNTSLFSPTMPANPTIAQSSPPTNTTMPSNSSMSSSQQQLLSLLQSNPQLMGSYSGAK